MNDHKPEPNPAKKTISQQHSLRIDSAPSQTNFKVWIRPLGDKCRIRVEARSDAQWLFSHLNSLPTSLKCEDTTSDPSGCYMFNVPFTDDMSCSGLRKILGNLKQIQLMSQPA